MSTTNNLPTRQQLEEIDALLKRMLSLPPLTGDLRDDPAPMAPTPVETSPVTPTTYTEPRIQSWRVEWPMPSQPAASSMPPVTPIPAQAPTPAHIATPASTITPIQSPSSAATPSANVAAWGSPVTQSPATPRFAVYTPPVASPTAQPVEQTKPYVSPPFSPAYPPGYAPQAYPTTPVPSASPVATPPSINDHVTVVPARSAWLFPFVALNWIYDILTYLLPMGSWWRTSGRVWMGRVSILMFLTAAAWAAGEWQGIEWPKADLSRINLSRFGWAK